MKTYKLRKWYPSLTDKIKKGDTVKYTKQTKPYSYIHSDSGRIIDKYEVERNPEFWEKEKSYEIISFRLHNGSMAYIQNNGEYLCTSKPYTDKTDGSSLEWILIKDSNWDIYCVKRLSDGEVFTLGDNICLESYQGKVDGFEVFDNSILVLTSKFGWYPIEDIQHVKKPLFTTEDGVNIFKGDEYWMIDLDYAGGTIPQKVCADVQLASRVKRFSTKEKAEEWIYNELRYSKNDIKDALLKTGIEKYRRVETFWEVLDDAR